MNLTLTLKNILRALGKHIINNYFLTISLFLIFGLQQITAQNYVFDRVDNSKNFNQESVTDIIQDKKGFLWVATDYALYRYDGINLQTFITDSINQFAPSNFAILDIFIDNEETIWAGSYSTGFYALKKNESQFKNFKIPNQDSLAKKLAVNYFAEYQDDIFIITNYGLYRSNKNEMNIEIIGDTTSYLIVGKVVDNYLVLGGDKGLKTYNLKTKEFDTSIYPKAKKFFQDKVIVNMDLFEDEIHFSTYNGFYIYDIVLNTIQEFTSSKKTDWLDTDYVISSNAISSNEIWLGTEGSGLKIYKRDLNKFETIKNDPNNLKSLNADFIDKIFVDSSNNIWIGGWSAGMAKTSQNKQRFVTKSYKKDNTGLINNLVWNFEEDKYGNIWIATEGGISIFNPATQTFQNLTVKNANLKNKYIYSLKYHDNFMWVGTGESGFFKIHIDSKKITDFKYNIDANKDIDYLPVNDIEYYKNEMYIATDYGIYTVDPKSNSVSYKGERLFGKKLLKKRVLKFNIDKNENLWISHVENGLSRLNSKESSFSNFIIGSDKQLTNDNSFMEMFIDSKNKVWIGSTKGFSIFDQLTSTIERVSLKDGLPNNVIYGIVEDNRGDYWVSTNNGISRYNYESNSLVNFNVSDGLQSKEFNQNAIFKASDGTIYFGGVNGFSFINPDRLKLNSKIPKTNISKIVLGEKEEIINGDKSTFYIDHDVTSIYIHLMSTDYSDPSKNLFSHFMTNIDKNWSPTSSNNIISYKNIDYGEFEFHAISSNNDFIWSTDTLKLKFIKKAPWYKNYVYYSFFALCLIIFVYALYLMRIVNLKRRQKDLETNVKDRTKELELSKNMLEHLNIFAREINRQSDLMKLVKVILKEAMEVTSIQKGSALIFDSTDEKFRFVDCLGWDLEKIKNVTFEYKEIDDWVKLDSKEIVEDVFISNEFNNKKTHLELPKTILTIRIKIENRNEAYFFFDNMEDTEAFYKEDITLIENLKEHIISAFNKTLTMDKLKFLNDKKNEFIGIAAHDLRSPLAQINGYADLMLMNFDMQENVDENLKNRVQKIRNAAEHMNELINTLLDISAIESGKVQLNLKKENYISIVDECEEMNLSKAKRKNITIHIDRPKQELFMNLDRVKIMEVVDNLIDNAIKYGHNNGDLFISFEISSNTIITHIKDNGLGMREDEAQKIFINFQPLSNVPTGGEKSTGFGLVIVKKIVELHHGKVWVKSSLNEGSTFSFSLPITI